MRQDGTIPLRSHAFILTCRGDPVDGGMTMQCRACAYENEAASRFCVACGVALAPVCARCGRDFPEAARFCASCGEPRKPDARIADVPGERKQATVLFADVAGSTARIAGSGRRSGDEFPASDRDGHGACGTPLRRHGASHIGRRAQGRVRGAARARGTCGARLPCRARHACRRRRAAGRSHDPDRPALGGGRFGQARFRLHRSSRM